MERRFAQSSLQVLAASAAFGLALAGTHLLAQAASDAPAAKLSALWSLNKDLSSEPPDSSTVLSGPPAGRGGGGPSRGGGGQAGGGGLGGFGGGRGGGYGGGPRGGGAGGGGGGASNVAAMAEMRVMLRELTVPAPQVAIVATPDQVTVTDDAGVVEKYVADGKTHKVDLSSANVDSKTEWDKQVLTQEFKSGALKVTRTWQTTDDGSQMVVTVRTENGGGGTRPALKFIYDLKP